MARTVSQPIRVYCYIAISGYNYSMSSQPPASFEWDAGKDRLNQVKHGVSFALAQYAFADPHRVILEDLSHSTPEETRYFCIGKIDAAVLTVRFTYRRGCIRIFGAGYWRKGKEIYEQENSV